MNFLKRIFFISLIFFLSCTSSKKGFNKNLQNKESDKVVDFVVYTTNDVHGNVVGDFGFAKEKTLVNETKNSGQNVLVLDAGDVISGGAPFASIDKGQSMIDIYNSVGIDAMAVGNHEFDYGQERLLQLYEEMNFPLLSANIVKDGKLLFEPYIIKNVGGLKVGIIGITTPETVYKTNPTGIKGINFLKPNDEFVVNEIKELANETDFVIAVTHLGVEGDYKSSLLYDIPGINLIVDGHSHTEVTQQVDEDTYIIQTGAFFKHLGQVKIHYDKGKITFDAKLLGKEDAKNIGPNSEVQSVIDSVVQRQKIITGKIIAHIDEDLNGKRNDLRTKPTNLGIFIAKSMFDSYPQADIAFANGGSIRMSIPAGDVNMGQAIGVLPFGNMIKIIRVTGKDIKKALEHGYDTAPEPAGHFPQTYGLTFDVNIENEFGNRISNIKIKDQALDLEQTYLVATNDFMTVGGDGYTMFMNKEVVSEPGTLLDFFITNLRKLSSKKSDQKEEVAAE